MLEILDFNSFAHYHTRVHPLRSQKSPSCTVFIKREDELGALSMGIKLRKYLSLIPYLKDCHKTIAITGSVHSNHVLALSLQCKQQAIPYVLVLDRPLHTQLEGNAFFLTLAHDPEAIIWVDSAKDTAQVAHDHPDWYWLPIGGSCLPALPGSLTLAADIVENEKRLGFQFDHIFTDSGTGFSASALHLGLRLFNHPGRLHVVQMAGIHEDLPIIYKKLEAALKQQAAPLASIAPLCLQAPATARAFGAFNRQLIDFIQSFARKEGIFLDPQYNAKLFFTALKLIEEDTLKGPALIIHSGGTLALSGFSKAFFKSELKKT